MLKSPGDRLPEGRDTAATRAIDRRPGVGDARVIVPGIRKERN
jgi:hypothetical protein